MALFSALDVSVRKKNATCTIFSAFCTKPNDPCVPNGHGNHYTSIYFILLSDRLIFRNTLSLEKNEYVSQHTMRVSTCIFHVQLAESRPLVINNDRIHILNRVSQSSFRIVAGTCPCINFVNAGDLE